MGGIPNKDGVTLETYDVNGTQQSTQTFKCCRLTGQNNPTNGTAKPIGSNDWLKEVYLAPDETSLYSLLRQFPATGYHPPLTSGASRVVTVHYLDAAGQVQSHEWFSVIALNSSAPGTTVPVPGPGGVMESLVVIDTLQVTDGDASTNGLQSNWHTVIPTASR